MPSPHLAGSFVGGAAEEAARGKYKLAIRGGRDTF
jgi:hypothetical protein